MVSSCFPICVLVTFFVSADSCAFPVTFRLMTHFNGHSSHKRRRKRSFGEADELPKMQKLSESHLVALMDELGEPGKTKKKSKKPGVNRHTNKGDQKIDKHQRELPHSTNGSPMEWVGIGVSIIAIVVVLLVIVLFCAGPSHNKCVANSGKDKSSRNKKKSIKSGKGKSVKSKSNRKK